MTCVAVHGTLVLAGAFDGSLRLWDVAGAGDAYVASARALLPCAHDYSSSACRVAFSPDGRRAASASSAGAVSLWDVCDAAGAASPPVRPLKTTWSNRDSVCGLCFAADGCSLLVACASGLLREWSFGLVDSILSDGRPCAGARGTMRAVCFHPRDPRQMLAGGQDGLLMLIEAPSGSAVCSVATARIQPSPALSTPPRGGADAAKAADLPLVALCFAGEGDGVALAVRWDGALVIVGRGGGGWLPCGGGTRLPTCCWQRHQAHASAVFGCAFSPTSRSVVSAGEDGLLRSLDVSNGGGGAYVVAPAAAHRSSLCFCALSPGGTAIGCRRRCRWIGPHPPHKLGRAAGDSNGRTHVRGVLRRVLQGEGGAARGDARHGLERRHARPVGHQRGVRPGVGRRRARGA